MIIMRNEPLISVIVPVYGVEEYLDRCVQSIVGQTYKNLQIILVDDGSPDACPAMCDAWAARDSRIRVIHKENGGLSDARNIGLAIAEGEYVSFVDSDDWLNLRFYEVLYRTAAEQDCQIAECGYFATTGDEPKPAAPETVSLYSTEEALALHLREKLFRQVVWNKLYRRDVITASFEKGKYHEDVFWTYQIIANCQRLAHVDVSRYVYFQREGSIMGQGYSLKRLDAVEAAAQRSRFVTEHYPKLAGLAQSRLIGTYMYHFQLIQNNSDIDPDKLHRKWIYKQALQVGSNWRTDAGISERQKLWYKLFLRCPEMVCGIRNFLSIGY